MEKINTVWGDKPSLNEKQKESAEKIKKSLKGMTIQSAMHVLKSVEIDLPDIAIIK